MATHSAMPPETSSPSTWRQASRAAAGCGRARLPQVAGSDGVARRQRLARLDHVVEGQPLAVDLLVGLVALAGDDDHVAGAGRLEGPPDGQTPTVGLDDHVADCRARRRSRRSTSSMMASGSSSRGLSEVRTARSLRRTPPRPSADAWPGPGCPRSRTRPAPGPRCQRSAGPRGGRPRGPPACGRSRRAR